MIAFGLGVKTLLMANTDLAALLPGGIHPDDVPDKYDFAKAGAVYKVVSGDPITSFAGPTAAMKVALGFTWIGKGASENRAAFNLIAKIIREGGPRVVAGGVTLCALNFGNYGTDSVSVGTNPNDNKRVFDFVITGVMYDPSSL